MRRFPLVASALALACLTACRSVPPAPSSQAPAGDGYGMTVEEEARLLALEDRRQYDAAFVDWWVKHPNALHRQRIALALGRIGPHAFLDTNGNGFLDSGETHAGVDELIALEADPDRGVRENVAFALGEIGDHKGVDALFQLAADSDAGVAAEAAEALSKYGSDPVASAAVLPRYLELQEATHSGGERARAIRYLFRFNSDPASSAAIPHLGSTSAVLRQEAAYSLARRPVAAARPQLELLLTDPAVLTRAYATTAVGKIADRASMPLMMAMLGDQHPWVRTNAAIGVGRIIAKTPQAMRPDDLPRIFATLEDADPGVRASIIDVVGAYAVDSDAARTRLEALLHNGTAWERELAAGAIAAHLPPDSASFKLLDEVTGWQAVRVLEATAEKPYGVAIRARYAGAPEPFVRANAIGSIPDAAANAEIDLIRRGLADDDVVVRATAIDRYAATTADDAPTRLATLRAIEEKERTNPFDDARTSAIAAIAKIDDPSRRDFLMALVNDRDPAVRRIAAGLVDETFKTGAVQYTPLPIARSEAEYQEIVRWSRQSHTATIHMPRGTIEMALLTRDAPMTTWNFATLAQKKYFDNTTFMRVVPNFVVQAGDPRNDMSGGPGYAIRDEMNLQKYTRGAVGMALSGPDTGGSQWFITHSPQPHLDGGYTVFGRIYAGMNGVVDQIERGDLIQTITIDERPVSAERLAAEAAVPPAITRKH